MRSERRWSLLSRRPGTRDGTRGEGRTRDEEARESGREREAARGSQEAARPREAGEKRGGGGKGERAGPDRTGQGKGRGSSCTASASACWLQFSQGNEIQRTRSSCCCSVRGWHGRQMRSPRCPVPGVQASLCSFLVAGYMVRPAMGSAGWPPRAGPPRDLRLFLSSLACLLALCARSPRGRLIMAVW
jgi:hypothetical protein